MGEGADQKIVKENFTPAPALTLFLKSDENIGTLTVSTGTENDVKVYVNNREISALQGTRTFPPEMMPSMAVDLLRGNRLELPWLAGKVVALGRELGVPTPTFDVMYAALKPYANGAPG